MQDNNKNQLYKILNFRLDDRLLAGVREELSSTINMMEGHREKYGDFYTGFSDCYSDEPARRGEVMTCLGLHQPICQFDFNTSGIELEVREYDRYWICYYLYKDKNNSYKNLACWVTKEPQSQYLHLMEVIKECKEETGMRVGESALSTYLLRTPPGCKWYKHVDVMSPKLVIPIYSEKGEFRFFQSEESDESLGMMPLNEGLVHQVDTHVWHSTGNFSDSVVRWNVTIEEPGPMRKPRPEGSINTVFGD